MTQLASSATSDSFATECVDGVETEDDIILLLVEFVYPFLLLLPLLYSLLLLTSQKRAL